MELDDLKQTWQQTEKTPKSENNDIIELIKHKSNGPVAALKKRFKKQMILILLLVAFIINSFSHKQIFTDVMFWSYITFCIALCLFFYFNYRLVSKMECMDCMIKSNLEQQVNILEKRLKWQKVGKQTALVFFIVLSETLTYFANEPMLEKWHSVPLFIRLLVYASLFTIQYFISPLISKRKYGRHLSYLKQLLNEMQ